MAVTELIAAYGTRYDTIRSLTSAAVERAWRQLAGPEKDRAAEFIAAAVVAVEAGQQATVELVDAYMAAYLTEVTGEGVGPLGLAAELLSGAATRAGVDPASVYERPVITLRRLLSEGVGYATAFDQAAGRATSTASTDVVLAHRAAATEVMSARNIAGYRRVLTGASCRLCATASTQRYHGGNLMPIHSHCDCRIAPIVGTEDPGRVINRPMLDALKAQPGLRTAVHEHGELGPVLTDRADHFTGPSQIP